MGRSSAACREKKRKRLEQQPEATKAAWMAHAAAHSQAAKRRMVWQAEEAEQRSKLEADRRRMWSDMRCAVDDAKRKQEAAEESVAWYAERTNVAWQETSRVMAERDALMLEHRRLCAQQPHVGTGVMWIADGRQVMSPHAIARQQVAASVKVARTLARDCHELRRELQSRTTESD
jgi:hypothetical protein